MVRGVVRSGKIVIPLCIVLGLAALAVILSPPEVARATGAANATATSKTGATLTVPQEFRTDCVKCHAYDASGNGPMHSLFMPDPANLTLIMDSPSMVASIVKNGIQGTAMGPHPDVTQTELSNILGFVTNIETNTQIQWDWPYNYFGLAAIPPEIRTTPQSVPLDLGRTAFVTSCAGCHGPDGRGDPDDLANPHIWPKPANFHARNSDFGRLYYIITYGRPGTLMGSTRQQIQTEETRWAAAMYVHSLFNPNSTDTIHTGPMETWKNPYSPTDQNVVNQGSTDGAVYCGYCHGGGLSGSWMAPDLTDREWRFGGGSDNNVYQLVNDGIPGQLMPPHKNLPVDTRWRIITYIRAQGGLPEAAVELPEGEGTSAR